MTENKRFNLWDIEGTAFIEDHKEGSYHIGKTEDVDINSLRSITKRLNIYAEENEQLKSDNNRLVNETAKVVAEHQKRVLDLIDEKIKLYSHKPISAPISQPMSVNFDADVDRLARLSELEALKEELTE